MVCEFSGDRLLLCIKTAQAVFLHLVVLGGGKPYADFGAQRQQVAFYRIVSCLLNRLFRTIHIAGIHRIGVVVVKREFNLDARAVRSRKNPFVSSLVVECVFGIVHVGYPGSRLLAGVSSAGCQHNCGSEYQ